MRKQLDRQLYKLSASSPALAERLATLSSHGKIDWSDSWTDEDLQDFRDATLANLEAEESEDRI
jgi:hypothetical protein